MAYHRFHGVETRIVRIFNTYGPRMRPKDGRAIPTFIPQALRHEPLTIFGNGQQTRSFCYVSDLVEGIYRLLTSGIHEPVNIGNPDEKTILQLAETIIRITESKSSLEHRDLPVNDPKVRQPDIKLAGENLNWSPLVELDEGLRKTIDWFRKKIKIP